MLRNICLMILIFIFYSFLGWCMEVITSLIYRHKFVNRGFLIGPYCPIYGIGCLLILFFLSRFKNEPIELFIMAIVICSALEYFTSYIMEKVFKTRWWDYSNKKYNINGRICLDTMIPFGILGCLVIYFINPAFIKLISNFSDTTVYVLGGTIFSIFIVDFIISQKLIFSLRSTIKILEKDATEEITKKVREIISKKSILYKRFISAFPTMKTAKERLIGIKTKITSELDKIDLKQLRKGKKK